MNSISSSYQIDKNAKWISIAAEHCPHILNLPATAFVKDRPPFTATEFYRSLTFQKPIASADIAVFADTKYRLTINGVCFGVGPVAAGGDYGNCQPMPKQYFNRYRPLFLKGNTDFEVIAEVQSPGSVQTDYSCGRQVFIFSAELTFSDGSTVTVISDENWRVRLNPRHISEYEIDATIPLPAWEIPEILTNDKIVWNLAYPYLPPLTEEVIEAPWVTADFIMEKFLLHAEFDHIYSAYPCISVVNHTDLPQKIFLYAAEYGMSDNPILTLTVPTGESVYRGFRMFSIGQMTAEWKMPDNVFDRIPDNRFPLEISLSLVYTHYPYDRDNLGDFVCSDENLNKIYKVGRMTLEMCRQTLHLDSPLHQETLGCTGDYAIESAMTHMTFGDMRLTRLDLIRTADYLIMTDGYMFHTTYSPIFVTMLLDYYRYTDDIETVQSLLPAIKVLKKRFDSYMADGVVMNPISFMFVEWGNLDGYSMHHPPRVLGQTVLNAFWQSALCAAETLFDAVGTYANDTALLLYAEQLHYEAKAHKAACLRLFYDEDRKCFRDGLTDNDTPDIPPVTPSTWLPANAKRHYYTRHANILAVLYHLIDGEEAKNLLIRVLTKPEDFEAFDIQPYFMHYLLEAVRENGLFAQYGLELLHLWDKQIVLSPKGMREGWNEFHGDNSHAWGATPTYQLPMAFSGFCLTGNGYDSFRLNPQLYGLAYADVTIPTPYGKIRVIQKRGKPTKIQVPDAYHFTDKEYKL